jgi:hypothetical protein
LENRRLLSASVDEDVTASSGVNNDATTDESEPLPADVECASAVDTEITSAADAEGATVVADAETATVIDAETATVVDAEVATVADAEVPLVAGSFFEFTANTPPNLMVDGVVRFVNDHVARSVWRGMGTRNGNETIVLP